MDILLNLFNINNGYLYSKDLGKSGYLYKKLKQLILEGKVEKLKTGLYKYKAIATLDDYQETCKIYPDAVLCMYSAWYFYSLTTFIPSKYHLAIPNKMKLVQHSYPPVKFYYWTKKYFDIGLINSDELRIYNLERTICDAVRFQNKIGGDIVKEVIKNYLKRSDKNLDKLFEISHQMDSEKEVRKIIDLLI